jgi:hypothetical protein
MNIVPANQNRQLADVPQEFLTLARPGGYRSDFGLIEPSDWGMNFVKIVNATSRQAKPGWGPNQNEQPMPQGTYILSQNSKPIPNETEFVPLLRTVTFIKFRGNKPSDGIEFITKDKNDPRILQCHGLDFRKDPNTGNPLPPLVTKFVNFYVITQYNPEEPAILSFFRASTKLGSALTKQIVQATKNFYFPMYTVKYKLKQPKLATGGGNTWYQIQYEPAGRVDPKSLPALQKVYDLACAIEAASTGEEFQETSDLEPAEEHEQETAVPQAAAAPAAQAPSSPTPAAPAPPITVVSPTPTPQPAPQQEAVTPSATSIW